MFRTSRVACYLNGFAGHGEDNDSKELKLIFHIAAISPDLASEISPYLADRLFRRVEGEWEPAREISKASFASVQVQMQNITFYSLPERDLIEAAPVLVQGCAISNLRAQRDAEGFRLEFDVVVPMDSDTMEIVEKYYKATTFLSMEPIQREIKYEGDAAQVEHQDALQEAADAEPADETAAETGKRKGRKKKGGTTVTLSGPGIKPITMTDEEFHEAAARAR